MGGGGGGSSSSDEDGDAAWKAAIDSIAAIGFGLPPSNGAAAANSGDSNDEQQQPQTKAQAPGLKLYQIKKWFFQARNMLDDFLDTSLEIVQIPCPNLSDTIKSNEVGIKLFKKAPPGMIVDASDRHHVQLKRPRILPGLEVNEKSRKFRNRLQSVVVEGNDIVVSAREACQRSLARFEAREAVAKVAAKREEERVRELKKIRGEKWLPSIARQMKEAKARTH